MAAEGEDNAGQLFTLFGQTVDNLQRRVLTKDAQHLTLAALTDVEHQGRAPACESTPVRSAQVLDGQDAK